MTVEQAVFAIAGVVCIGGSVVAVTHRAPRAAGAALMATLVSLAVLYVGLAAPTLAAIGLIVALFATVPLVVHLTVPAARARTDDEPALGGAALILGIAFLAMLAIAVAAGEVPVNVSVRSSDGYDVAALRDLLTGHAAAAVGGSVLLLFAGAVAARAARRDPGGP